MGTCTGKQTKRRNYSSNDLQINKHENIQQPSVQMTNNVTQLVSPLCYQTNDDELQLPPSQNYQKSDNNELRDEAVLLQLAPLSATIAEDISQEKGINKIENIDKPSHQIYNQDEEEEKIDLVKNKNTLKSLDQVSTQITFHHNDLASKKENQTSDTLSNNPFRQKKPTMVQSFDQGITVQIFEPTQNSMDEALSINEVDEEDMDDEQFQMNENVNFLLNCLKLNQQIIQYLIAHQHLINSLIYQKIYSNILV